MRERRAAARRGGVAHRGREAEVGDQRRAVRSDEHVGGLEVAVHEPARVQGRESLGDAGEHRQQRAPRTPAQRREVAGRELREHRERRVAVVHGLAVLQARVAQLLLQSRRAQELLAPGRTTNRSAP